VSDLLGLSARIIDDGSDEPVNRLTLEVSEVADGVAVVESFSHVVALDTNDGLLLFDTSLEALAGAVLTSLRSWSDAAVDTIVYTHGHADHVGGAGAVVAEAENSARRRPRIVGHSAVEARFDRYDMTRGWNESVNARQFSGGRRGRGKGLTFPQHWIRPNVTYESSMTLEVGGLQVVLHHDRGETDDHTWAWIPSLHAVACGDLVIWMFPNAGNPQKVQRYPLEWARALRRMAALEPELLLPAHGLPVAGRDRIGRVLGETALALESLVDQTLDLMNGGADLDEIIATVKVPDELADRPYLRPAYDEPEFVVRNIWRLYGGWWDGNPAHLKPARDAELATEISRMVGGSHSLADRAVTLAEQGQLRLACHLVEMAAKADPVDRRVHELRAVVYRRRREEERSLMAKGIFGAAAEESEARAES